MKQGREDDGSGPWPTALEEIDRFQERSEGPGPDLLCGSRGGGASSEWPKRAEKDTSEVRKWEKIGKEIKGKIYKESDNSKILERTFSKIPEIFLPGSHQKNRDVRPPGIEWKENPIG